MGDYENRRGEKGTAERRVYLRAPISCETNVEVGDEEYHGLIVDISEGGVFVATDDLAGIAAGDGLRMRFQISRVVEMNLFVIVRWLQLEPGDGRDRGFGAEFAGLDAGERRLIGEYVTNRSAAKDLASIEIHARHKYSTQIRENAVYVQMNGYLTPDECHGLCEAMSEKVKELPGDALLTFIDATRFSACPEESLPILREFLGILGQKTPAFGVMIGGGSVAMLQMRRLAREAGVADALACFEDDEEAAPFWQDIRQTVLGLSHE